MVLLVCVLVIVCPPQAQDVKLLDSYTYGVAIAGRKKGGEGCLLATHTIRSYVSRTGSRLITISATDDSRLLDASLVSFSGCMLWLGSLLTALGKPSIDHMNDVCVYVHIGPSGLLKEGTSGKQ